MSHRLPDIRRVHGSQYPTIPCYPPPPRSTARARRVRARGGKVNNTAGPSATTPSLLPAPLKDFKAFDALAAGGAISTDCRQTPCPLCARVCGGQRGLRMHILDAHPAELRDREHLVQLLTQASTFLSPPSHESNTTSLYSVDGESGGLGRGGQDSFRGDHEEDVVAASTSSTRQAPRVGAGAAAKGKAGATLPPGFAAAREGRMEDLKRLVEGLGEEPWDPKRATDKNGSGPLDWAAGEGRLEVCRQGVHPLVLYGVCDNRTIVSYRIISYRSLCIGVIHGLDMCGG